MTDSIKVDDLLARKLLQAARDQRQIFFDLKNTQPEKALAACHRYVLALTQPITMLGQMNDQELNQALFDLGKKFAPQAFSLPTPPGSKIIAGVSTLYDVGGHTRCLDFLIKGLKTYQWHILESAYDGSSREKAKAILDNLCEIPFSTVPWEGSWIKQAQGLAEKIIHSGASQLLLMVHPDDLVWPIVLGMVNHTCAHLKTHFYDHADHRFSLGRNLCHSYVCFREFSLSQAKKAGALHRFVIPLAASSTDFTRESEQDFIDKLPDKFTFGAAYTTKLMSDKSLTYFQLIAKGLKQNPDYIHIQMTTMSSEEKKCVKRLLLEHNVSSDRLILISNTSNWHKYVRTCQAVLSSYPFGGGLVMLDLAKAGKPFLAFGPPEHIGWQLLTDCPEAKEWIAENEEAWLQKLHILLNDEKARQKQCQAIQSYHNSDNVLQKWKELLNGQLPLQKGTSMDWHAHSHAFCGLSISACLEYTWLHDWLNHPYSKPSSMTKARWLSQLPPKMVIDFFKDRFVTKTIFGRLFRSGQKRFRKFRISGYPKIQLHLRIAMLSLAQRLGLKTNFRFFSRIKLFDIPLTSAKKYALSKSLNITEILPEILLPIPTPKFFNEPPRVALPSHPVNMPSHDLIHLTNVMVFGSSQLILTQDGQAIYDEINDPRAFIAKSCAVREYHEKGLDLLVQMQGPFIEEAIHLCIDYGQNYFHWMVEAIPKLMGIERNPLYQNIPLLIDIKLPAQILEALKAIVGKQRVLIPLWDHKTYLVKKLIYPTPVNFIREPRSNTCSAEKDTWIRPESIDYIRLKFYTLYEITPKPSRRFFVFRHSPLRSAKNLNEVKEIASSFGYEALDTSTMSFEEQVRTFAQASHILFQSGAAFTNVFFAPNSCKVAVTFGKSEKCNYSLFQFIPDQIGIDMRYLICEADPFSHSSPWHRSYVVNLDELKLTLQKMG